MPVDPIFELELDLHLYAQEKQAVFSRDMIAHFRRAFGWTTKALAKSWRAVVWGGEGLLELLYPPSCAVCQMPLAVGHQGSCLCRTCLGGNWRLREESICKLCCAPRPEGERLIGRWDGHLEEMSWLEEEELSLQKGAWWEVGKEVLGRCPTCFDHGIGVERCFACFAYAGSVRALLRQWKYHRDPFAGRALCALFYEEASRLLEEMDAYDWIIPVPLSRKRLHWRGFHQAWELTRALGPLWKAKMHPEALCRRDSKTQVGLSAEERRKALSGQIVLAPWAKDALCGKRVLLVDDVVTTGSTLGTCADILRQADVVCVDALALCRAI